ncbi:hypothetical protein MTO96_010723 [Rhipicephalus appendiculatus]
MDPVRPLSEEEQLLFCTMINWMGSSSTMLPYVLSQMTPKARGSYCCLSRSSPLLECLHRGRRKCSIQAPLQDDEGDALECDGDPVARHSRHNTRIV